MLAALVLLAALQHASSPVHWECSRGGIRQAEGHLDVLRRLDADGSVVDDQLGWRIFPADGQFARMAWSFSGDSAGEIRLDSMFAMIGLSREPAGRLWAIMRADGHEVSRAPVAPPSPHARDGQGRLVVNVDYRNGPVAWTSERPTASPPVLGEASDVELRIEEERGGFVLARVRLPMPDWAGTRREVALIRAALGEVARDFRTRCRDVVTPVRVPLIVLPGR